MSRLAVFAFALGLLALGGCAFHHEVPPRGERPDYVDWEPEPRRWGEHYYHYDSDR